MGSTPVSGALVLALVVLGATVNNASHGLTVSPDAGWCGPPKPNATGRPTPELPPETAPTPAYPEPLGWPAGLTEATVAVAVAGPLLPLALCGIRGPAGRCRLGWEGYKTELARAHLTGQAALFGVSETVRRFVASPDSSFLRRCNLTEEQCLARAADPAAAEMVLTPSVAAAPLREAFCAMSRETAARVYDALHSFPDPASGIAGASAVSLALVSHRCGRRCGSRTGASLALLLACQCLAATCYLVYAYRVWLAERGYGHLLWMAAGAALQLALFRLHPGDAETADPPEGGEGEREVEMAPRKASPV